MTGPNIFYGISRKGRTQHIIIAGQTLCGMAIIIEGLQKDSYPVCKKCTVRLEKWEQHRG